MPAEITTMDAQYALELVKKICTEVGPGLPGTPQERQRAELIKKELETHLGAGNVVAEEFHLCSRCLFEYLPGSALYASCSCAEYFSRAFHGDITLDYLDRSRGVCYPRAIDVHPRVPSLP